MSRMEGDTSRSLVAMSLGRAASGTSWLPDAAPRRAIHRSLGDWMLMAHGSVFGQYDRQETLHGDTQLGVVDWEMFMAARPLAQGLFTGRVMTSLEALALGRRGYPELLQSGAEDAGARLANRQHPHDLWNEIAVSYDHSVSPWLAAFAYGAAVGEPALGPVAYMHRPSADADPFAPIGHHWQDAAHESFGVITAGVYGARARLEGSVFNGREPDENRWNFDFGALDSYSARLSVAPTTTTVLQVSAGRLNDAEREAGLPPNDVTRVTASAMYHRALNASSLWASTIAWGMNDEPLHTTHALLVESTWSSRDRHVGFMRFEVVGKPAHDLHVHESTDIFTVGKIQLGYAYYLRPTRGLQLGMGGSVAGSLVPEALAPRYGGRVSPGIAVFLTVRPAAHAM